MKLPLITYSGIAALAFTHAALGQIQLNTVCALPPPPNNNPQNPDAPPGAVFTTFLSSDCTTFPELHTVSNDNLIHKAQTGFSSVFVSSLNDPVGDCDLTFFLEDLTTPILHFTARNDNPDDDKVGGCVAAATTDSTGPKPATLGGFFFSCFG